MTPALPDSLSPSASGSALGSVFARYRAAFGLVALLSVGLNALVLGGSLYTMMLYDSVLPSHSAPTLAVLFVLICGVYVFQAVFDVTRGRILNDIAQGFDRRLAPQLVQAMVRARGRGVVAGDALAVQRDFDSLRTFLAGTGPATLMDMPSIPLFLGVLFLLHVWLGVAATFGTVALFGLAILTDRMTRNGQSTVALTASHRTGAVASILRHSDLFGALGMGERMQRRWEALNAQYRAVQDRLTRQVGTLGVLSRSFRLALQALIMTVGALLVIRGHASGGVIFAASLLSGRALAPVDQVIGNWRSFSAARLGWRRVDSFLHEHPPLPPVSVALPAPASMLTVDNVSVAPPGSLEPSVTDISFRLAAGEALGIIGPSAAGKSTLGRAMVGAWPTTHGHVRLDGATLDQWPATVRGRHIGYLPQEVELIDGTVAQNIARFLPDADPAAITAAARAANAHDLIVGLPHGYDTPVGDGGAYLSAGQRQRVGLARALFGDPFLVLLDEPNSNLDAVGEEALRDAIRQVRARSGIVVIIAHRASILGDVDQLLLLRDGSVAAFGPRDTVFATLATPALSDKGTTRPRRPAASPARAATPMTAEA